MSKQFEDNFLIHNTISPLYASPQYGFCPTVWLSVSMSVTCGLIREKLKAQKNKIRMSVFQVKNNRYVIFSRKSSKVKVEVQVRIKVSKT